MTELPAIVRAGREGSGDGPRMRHGSDTERLSRNPSFGTRFQSQETALEFVPGETYEANYVTDRDLISFPLGPSFGEFSFDSDKIQPLSVTPGCAFFIPTGVDVYIRKASASAFCCVEVPQHLREELVEDIGRKNAPSLEAVTVGLRSNSFLTLGHRIQRFIAQNPVAGKAGADELSAIAYSEILGTAFDWHLEEHVGKLEQKRLDMVVEYIEDNGLEDVSNSTLASLTGLSMFHFTRSFKEALGFTPHQYILQRRITLACEALAKPESSIADVAYEAGFSSQAHMTTQFKRRLGVSPRNYKLSITA